jgi:hypothetical protein
VATCKFKPAPPPPPPDLVIKKSDLPVTCKLDNPPAGVQIALAEYFETGKPPTNLPSPDGRSFVIPQTVGSGRLEVRITGGPNPIPPIRLIEDCDASQLVLIINDPVGKNGRADIKVLA